MCVPLNLNAGFVEDLTEGDQKVAWGYKLGPVGSDQYSSEYTFRQYSDPFLYDVRSYTMSTYLHVYSMDDSQNYWRPIKALDIRPDLIENVKPYSLTIMFINSCRIFYKEASDDPIFPADTKWRQNEDLWFNSDSRARPLACIDWVDMKPAHPANGNGSSVFPFPNTPSPDQFKNFDKTDNFARFALNRSFIFSAIEFRGATGLDAQYKIQDDISLPLSQGRPQWITESWNLFNTSLARIQYDALDIANGTGWDNPIYAPKLPRGQQEDMCGIFSFQVPRGYNNISISILTAELLVLILVFILGWKTETELDEELKQSGWFGDEKLLVVEKLPSFCSNMMTKVSGWLQSRAQNQEEGGVAVESGSVPSAEQVEGTGTSRNPAYDTFSGDNSQAQLHSLPPPVTSNDYEIQHPPAAQLAPNGRPTTSRGLGTHRSTQAV